MKTNTKKLVLTGLLVAIEIILSRFFSVQLPFFRISAAFIPLVLMGMLCGPAYAGAGGAMADFIGAVLFPAGAYFPGFTLTNALTGVAYGVGLYRQEWKGARSWLRITVMILFVNLVLNLCLNTYWMSIIWGEGYLGLLPARLGRYVIQAPIYILVIGFMQMRLSRIRQVAALN